VPILLENIAYLVAAPGDLSEAAFIGEVLSRTDCGLLLDLHNLYANALNHHYDPIEFLSSLPLERIHQVHIAGGHDEGGYRIDSHAAPAPDAVWDLLEWLAGRAPIRAAIVEWDRHLPPFEVIQGEARKARAILAGEAIGAA